MGKITIEQRNLGKFKASLKLVAEYLPVYMKALKAERHLPIPVFSMQARMQHEMKLRALFSTPTSYFKPDGTLDKRRVKRALNKSKITIIGANI